MTDTAVRLQKCFNAVFPQLPEASITTASAENVPAWDSVAMVNLVALIEEEFGVAIDFEDMEELTSFDRILAYLSSKATA